MKYQYIFSTAIFIFFLLSWNMSYGQIKAVNDKGEKIILYPDGSWEYDKEEENTGENDKNKSNSGEGTSYSSSDIIEASEDLTRRYRTVRSQKEELLQQEVILKKRLSNYKKEIEQERARGNFPSSTQEEKEYLANVKKMNKEIKQITKERKSLAKEEKQYKKILTLPSDKLMASYQKLMVKEQLTSDEEKKKKKGWNPLAILQPKEEDPAAKAKADYEKQLEEVRKKNAEVFDAKLALAKQRIVKLQTYEQEESNYDVEAPCDIAFDEVDNFTGVRKRGTVRQLLFSAIEDRYESGMKGKGYVVGEGFISEVNGKNYMLIMDFMIRSKNASKDFGGIKKGGRLFIQLMSGKTITLKSNKSDRGEYNVAKRYTLFKGYYALNKSDIKALQESEVSVVRIHWANGFKDYPVTELDFFKNQLNCIKSKKK